MSEKLVFKVSPVGAENANYLAVEEVPTSVLSSGDTLFVYPGTYSDPATANVDNISVVGVGRREDIEFTGFTIPATVTGTITLKNLKIASPGLAIGNTSATINVVDCIVEGAASEARSASLAAGNAAITKGTAGASYAVVANSTLVVDGSDLSTGTAYGIVAHDFGSITVRNTVVNTDAGILANGACTIQSSVFTGANNYVSTPASVLSAPTHTVSVSAAAAANAGNCVESVVATIS